MPTTSHGERRYPSRSAADRAHPGEDVGTPLSPASVLIELRVLLALDEQEIVTAIRAGAAAAIVADPEATLIAAMDDLPSAVAGVREVTKSRVTAWRKRDREMTWDECRLLLLGLRSLQDR